MRVEPLILTISTPVERIPAPSSQAISQQQQQQEQEQHPTPPLELWRSCKSFQDAILLMNPNTALYLIKIMAWCNLGSLVFQFRTLSWWIATVQQHHQEQQDSSSSAFVRISEEGIMIDNNDHHNDKSWFSSSSSAMNVASLTDMVQTVLFGPNGGDNNNGGVTRFETRIIWLWLLMQVLVGIMKLYCRFFTLRQINAIPQNNNNNNNSNNSNNSIMQLRSRLLDIVQSNSFQIHVKLGRIAQCLTLYGFLFYIARAGMESVPVYNPSIFFRGGGIVHSDKTTVPNDAIMRSEMGDPITWTTFDQCPNIKENDAHDDETLSMSSSSEERKLNDSSSSLEEEYNLNTIVLIEVCCTNIVISLFRSLLVLAVIRFHAVQERRLFRRQVAARKEREHKGLSLEEIALIPTMRYQQPQLQPSSTDEEDDSLHHNNNRSRYERKRQKEETITTTIITTTSIQKRRQACCSICLEVFRHGDMLTVLPCDGSHLFHEDCIQEWLVKKSSCPLCQTNLRSIMNNSTSCDGSYTDRRRDGDNYE